MYCEHPWNFLPQAPPLRCLPGDGVGSRIKSVGPPCSGSEPVDRATTVHPGDAGTLPAPLCPGVRAPVHHPHLSSHPLDSEGKVLDHKGQGVGQEVHVKSRPPSALVPHTSVIPRGRQHNATSMKQNGEGLTTDVNTHAVHMKGQENGALYFCLVCNTKSPTILVIYNLDVLDGKIS